MYRRGARPPKGGVEKIVGYVTVQPDRNNDSDNESDDDDEEWLDEKEMIAISLGGTLLKQTTAKNQRITIKTFGHKGKSYVVKGRFPLHDPWWKITCSIYRNVSNPNMYFVDHTRPILYDIRTDELVVTHKLVNICLTTSQEPYFVLAEDRDIWNDKLIALEKYVSEHPTESLYFDNMKNLLKNFDEVCEKYETGPIRDTVERSDAVKVVYGAVEFAQLFTFLAQLLPKKFTEIIKLGGRWLKKLDNCREEYVWEFAFSNIMFKQYGMIGVEASLYDYLRCELLTDMPSMNCDAIYIYDFLKKDARESGHTFIEKFRIRKSKFTNDHQVVNWDASLKYLEQHRIIKTEGKDQTMKIFLRRNWEAERDVAKTLSVLLKDSGSYFKNEWDVDFTSSDFENIHNDVDQWKAAHLISCNPVAVLSGKGGCGKTTVVTQLLKHVCENSKSQVPLVVPNDQNGETVNAENGDKSVLNESLDQTSSSDQSTQFYKSPWKSYRQMTQEAKEAESSEDESDEEDEKYLSKTSVGQSILLTAPTGKAANLLGRKACMESVTLHHVIMSYKGFCKRKADYLREMNKQDPEPRKREESSDEDNDDNEDLDDEDHFMQTQQKFQNQNQNNPELQPNQFCDSEDQNLDSETLDNEPLKKEVDPQMPVWKYKDKSILVVDECSLVSVRTIATVMNNLRHQARLQKVILLGDVRQLPSVEPGNFLADIFRVLYPIGCCMELRTNHRAESELIVNNASKISVMKLPQYDNSKFQLRPIDETDDEIAIDNRINHLLRTSTDLNQETSQFVSFQRRRCESINELCCKFYNNHVTKDSKRKYLFQVGDKVCLGKNAEVTNHKERLPIKEKASKKKNESRATQKVVRNGRLDVTQAAELTLLESDDESLNPSEVGTSQVKPKKKPLNGLKKDKKKNSTVKLCNGEIFFIVKDIEEMGKDGKSTRYIILSDKEQPKEKLVCVNYKDLVNRCKMRHGWARTIHTYQGSESAAVVYVVYRSYYENWQHVYTAVTRGRNSVYMVGKKSSIDKAIRTDKKERRTSLKEKLMQRVEKFPEVLQKQRENLLERLSESEDARQRKIMEGEDGETELFGSDDDNDNYINALCDLLPPSQSSSEDNSEGTVINMTKCALEQNVACEINSNKGDDSDLIEEDSSYFDSDDSYMKTLDESAFIMNSQMQEASQFTQYRNNETSHIQTTPESQNKPSSIFETPSKESACKRLSSMESEHESPQKLLRMPDPSVLISPVRRCLERSLSFPKK